MSRLFFNDTGRNLSTHNEEITRWRTVRKELKLPTAAARASADLWMLLYCYGDNRRPLTVTVNGKNAGRITPRKRQTAWTWWRHPLPRGVLRPGVNRIELSCNAPAMNAWVLAIDPSVAPRHSALSLDRGRTWQNEHMGAHSALRGEYLIRLRSHAPSLDELRPPRVVYEDPRNPRVREMVAVIPAAIRRERDPWKQVLALRTWVASRWVHYPYGPCYAPWDPWTLLDWTRREAGHHAQADKTAFCVHFGAMFTALAAALGHRARCVAITRDINSHFGHFVAEVFHPRRRWVLHDANYDMHYEADGVPLSAVDLADRAIARKNCIRLVKKGPAFPYRGPARLLRAFKEVFGPANSYRNVSVWSLNQYISNPTVMPPNHGKINYSETDFVWYAPPAHDPLATAMFPYRCADRAWFEQAPPLE